jgi:hypothetical protein
MRGATEPTKDHGTPRAAGRTHRAPDPVPVLAAVAVAFLISTVVLYVQESPAAPATGVYSVSYAEAGLPVGTAWSVTLANLTVSRPAPMPITFSESDGSYAYSVAPVPGYSPSPVAGSVTVDGAPLSLHVPFAASGRPIQHAVVIVLEDESAAAVFAQSAYLRYLSATYGNVSDYYAECHGSLPNYASMTSGRYFACGTDSVNDTPVENLPDLLEQAGDSWAGYFEGMESPCQTYSQGSYQTDHNPFLIYEDISWNASRCDSHVVNSASFNESLAAGTLPTVSFYVPNRYDDCRHSSLAYCSAWIQGFLSPILNSTEPAVRALVAHTAFFVTFDEGLDDGGFTRPGVVNPWCQQQTGLPLAACGGHTYFTVVSPYSLGTSYRGPATGYDLESTLEWLFGLGSDGGYDGTTMFPSLDSTFTFATNQ